MANHRLHGLSDTPEYPIWAAIKNKCLNSKNRAYPRFGGRGITLYEPWHEFEAFFQDVGPRPTPDSRLERLDKKGNFEPGNIQWKGSGHFLTTPSKAPSRKALQLIGRSFHCLEVLGLTPYQRADGKRFHKALVRCQCGTEFEIFQSALGKTTSCGCSRDYSEVTGNKNYQFMGHGEIRSGYWKKVQEGARTRKLSFNLSVEDAWRLFLTQKRRCALTGVELKFGPNQTSRKEHSRTASLDRIDSSLGYSIDNVQWVHRDLNLMRMDLPLDVFIQWCHRVATNRPLPTHKGGVE
jgi:hypothetical protein